MRLKSKIRTESEFARRLTDGLRTASRRPNIYGYDPHDKQIPFHMSPARKRLFIGGNRSGKTVGGAAEAVWRATGEHPYLPIPRPPTHGRVVAVDYVEGVQKITLPEIARWMPISKLLGNSWETAYNSELRTLTLENGSTMEFMSYEQKVEKFAGTSRHWIWFDEEPPQDVYVENLLRVADTGGCIWITMTPVEGMTWTHDDLYEKANPAHEGYDPDIFVVEVDMSENPHLNSGEIAVLLAGLDDDERAAREHGQYVQRGGLIYPNFHESIHVVDPMEARQFNTENWLHFSMMDHGFTNATVWLWAAIDRDARMVVYDEYYKTKEIVSVHAAEVHTRNSQHGIPPTYSVGDPSIRNVDPITGTSVQIAYIECDIPIVLGNNDFAAGSNAVRTKFGNDEIPTTLYIARNCPHTIYEVKRYRNALWPNRKMDRQKNKKEEPHKKDDHCMDALRYGVASRPMVEDFSVPEDSVSGRIKIPGSPYSDRADPGTIRQSSKIVDEILGSEW